MAIGWSFYLHVAKLRKLAEKMQEAAELSNKNTKHK
jgi:hypothetical protein